MVAEHEHKQGEIGALDAKHYLDCTTLVKITFTVYDDDAQCTLLGLGDTRKEYDLTGFLLGENMRPLFVEVKNMNYVGKQSKQYQEFLANAYSITAGAVAQKLDRKIEFMWLTWHPFDQTKWRQLTSEDAIREAVAEHPEKLGGHEVSEFVIRLVAPRIWLIPMHRRHGELLMTRQELLSVYTTLERKGI